MGGVVIVALFAVVMLLWLFTILPAGAPYADPGRRYLAFSAVLLLALYIFFPGLR